jgi:hypothetical protein
MRGYNGPTQQGGKVSQANESLYGFFTRLLSTGIFGLISCVDADDR